MLTRCTEQRAGDRHHTAIDRRAGQVGPVPEVLAAGDTQPSVGVDLIDAELVLTRTHVDAGARVELDDVRCGPVVLLAADDVPGASTDLDAVAAVAERRAVDVRADIVATDQVIVRSSIEDQHPRAVVGGEDVPIDCKWTPDDRVRRAVDADAGDSELCIAQRPCAQRVGRSEEHTSELQSLAYLVCRLLLEKK